MPGQRAIPQWIVLEHWSRHRHQSEHSLFWQWAIPQWIVLEHWHRHQSKHRLFWHCAQVWAIPQWIVLEHWSRHRHQSEHRLFWHCAQVWAIPQWAVLLSTGPWHRHWSEQDFVSCRTFSPCLKQYSKQLIFWHKMDEQGNSCSLDTKESEQHLFQCPGILPWQLRTCSLNRHTSQS